MGRTSNANAGAASGLRRSTFDRKDRDRVNSGGGLLRTKSNGVVLVVLCTDIL